jgi:archaeal flagellar protein FlaJ
MKQILDEQLVAQNNIYSVLASINNLEVRYQQKQINFKKYNNLKNKILSNRSKDEVFLSYKKYIASLKNRIKQLNSAILFSVENDRSFESLKYVKDLKKKQAKTVLPNLDTLDISDIEIAQAKIEEKRETKEINDFAHKNKISIVPPRPSRGDVPKVPAPVNLNFMKRLVYAIQAKEKPWLKEKSNESIVFGGIFSKEFFSYIFSNKQDTRPKPKDNEIFGRTKILPSILSYEKGSKQKEISTKQDVLNPYLLEKQIKELKHIISKKKPEIYKANSLGYLANITVRKISIYFIEKYPGFFKKIYQSVRYANLKILANTYINIMFFVTMIIGIVFFPIFIIFFAFQGGHFGLVFLKTMLGTTMMSGIAFGLGSYYPNIKAKARRTSINTNLPFAIDHMASVIASGVSPAVMFKLISNSREYGDISIEIEKVSNYIDFFGYDILTALRAVALVTPSQQFKEFIDGFVSTIETGGDIKEFLTQKSQEALLNYRLERQKYVESLGTYSDIYTGVLIAAPLFFVVALSLVSVLGGKIGGVSVNTIITIGTYLVIPAMNILFIIFLELNQPEI